MGGAPGSRDTPSEDGSGLEEADRDQITPPLGAACGHLLDHEGPWVLQLL